ncbi:MFS transporter [Nocardia canadensis]|uniref:MFS transporter n=1 Tax=Nocardia canadensis TaxID=3065238 RepID=UPI00292D07AB|nr:MFS transporter [Nocardia canadensis]
MAFVQRWRVITAFALVGAATQVVWLNYAPVTTVAADHFGVSESAVGWLANMFPLLYVVLAIPAGILLDRWFRPALIAGAVLTAIGADLRLLHDSFAMALLGQTIVAIAQPLVLNAITGVAGHYLAEKDRPTGIAVGTASTFAGMAAAFVLGAILPAEHQLWTLTAVGAGFASVAALLLTVEVLRPGQVAAGAALRRPAGEPLAALRVTLRDPYVRRLCAAVFFPFGTFVALATYGQALLEPAGVSADAASVVLLINVVAGVVGCAVVPVAVLRRGVELPAVMVGLTASALACLLVAVAPGLATGFLAFVLIGLTLLPALPIVLTMTERHTGVAEGTAAGLIWMTGNFGGLVVAGATGLLVDRPAAAFGLCAVATMVGVPLVLRLRREPVAVG